MKTNVSALRLRTHEGAPAHRTGAEEQLRRSLLCCMLWEDTFYESGKSIADRIAELVPQCDPVRVGLLAVEAREQFKLRHAPLWIALAMVRAGGLHRRYAGAVLEEVIQRPDELTEFLALYWKDGREKLAAQVKKGLARAFHKFSAYSLAKYNQDGAVKLRDVLFLTHAKPKDAEQAETWKQLIAGTLPAPDTWEVSLSSGGGAKTPEEKRERWQRLLSERKLGALALLRNLRNMNEAGVPRADIEKALGECNPERVLPFRFIAAARVVPALEPSLEPLMLSCLEGREKLPGHTVLLVDHSGSMSGAISSRSELTRFDAACGLAILARELCERVTVLAFSERTWEIPARRGFALADALKQGSFGNTMLGQAVRDAMTLAPERLIALTDEQSADPIPGIVGGMPAYMVNVASYQNGVGYGNGWQHVNGWSEAILDYIAALEKP